MKPAIFLDRDGVVCEEVSYITSFSQMKIFDYLPECVRRLKAMGYLVIVITNQSAVARELLSEKKLIEIHNKMNEVIHADAIYYCPHLPIDNEKGLNENNLKPVDTVNMYNNASRYSIECDCRKPKPGMILRAAKDFGINLEQSYMIGDTARDIAAGYNAGVKTVLLTVNKCVSQNIKADYIFNNLKEFTDYMGKD